MTAAKCRYATFHACTENATVTVDGRGYCVRHATMVARIRKNIDKHRPLLNRMAREGDCGACRVAWPNGCPAHRADVTDGPAL